jgi:hypothetical protein
MMPKLFSLLPTISPQRRRVLGDRALVVLSPLFVLIALLTAPILLLFAFLDFLQLRHYCWKHQVWTFLVSTHRRGWREFVQNNVAPMLPEGLGLLWTGDVATSGNPMRWLTSAIVGQVKPCIVHVTLFRVRSHSIHARLKDQKWRRRADVAVQSEVQRILREELERIFGETKRRLL